MFFCAEAIGLHNIPIITVTFILFDAFKICLLDMKNHPPMILEELAVSAYSELHQPEQENSFNDIVIIYFESEMPFQQ
ncbi:hypothetical protein DP650_23460 [Salmonella enterica]|nr:hypothetical protein [Salmonella enterica]EBI9052388.1 hypothetical protein [Salmonella enterica]EBJ2155559.1 hypothetical protein [Salmonella enterica]EBW8722230.1 hypothetical protein [Salmonella enterica subsp. enterica serovar Anatum]ECT4918429.1 hypothetical protein [Salmonella enterica subsp. enterica serovar Newport]